MRWGSMTLLIGLIGCTAAPDRAAETVPTGASPATFTGAWRSVTPSLEFVGLSVSRPPRNAALLATRLTFSGVAWEGNGQMVGDSLIANVTVVGAPTTTGVLVAHGRETGTLRVQFRPGTSPVLMLAFVRDD